MKLEEIVNTYIGGIKRFKPEVTGADVYAHYKTRSQEVEIEPFTRFKFQPNFDKVVRSQEQEDYAIHKSKEIAQLAQKMFEKRFPQYYAQDLSKKFKQSLEH